MAGKNQRQTHGKRNRERAIAEKRRLKLERKETERAERAAAVEAGLPPPEPAAERAAAREADAELRAPSPPAEPAAEH